MTHVQPYSPNQGYQSDQDMPYKAAKLKEVVQTNLPIETKVKDVCKDVFTEFLHTLDPELAIKTLNTLPTEKIAVWQVAIPEDATTFFENWLDSKVFHLYPNQKKMEQELKTIYQEIKKQSNAAPATVADIDQLARNILKEYSKTIEDQATDDAFLTSYFAKELQIPSKSKLMRLTIDEAKPSISKVVSERLGYLYSDCPRERLKNVLSHDYPNQIDQVSYLVNLWSKSRRKFAPIWEQ